MEVQKLLGPNGLMHVRKNQDGLVTVCWGPLPFYSYREDDPEAKKLGMVLLANQGMTHTSIGELFNVRRDTVRICYEVYLQSGIPGLRAHHQGPQRIDEATSAFVIAEYLRLDGTRGYQEMILKAVAEKAQAGKLTCAISRSKMQKIIKAHNDAVRQMQKDQQAAAEREAAEKSARELRLQQQAEEAGKPPKQSELELSTEQMCVEHGGAAAVIPLLGQLGLGQALPAEPEQLDTLYSLGELVVSYAALNAAQHVEVEQDFKLVHSDQMGGIIGRKRLPCLSLFRQRIPQAVEQMDMLQVMIVSARMAAGQFGTTRIAYIDGHFMPYHGQTATLCGYNTQRRLAMPGREYVYVHDEAGVPIYAALSDGYRKMQYYVESLDSAIRGIYGVGVKEILEVFDRGGYSRDFLIGICDKIKFICWRTDARQVPTVPDDAWIDVSVERQGNTVEDPRWKRLGAWERTTTLESEGRQGTFREIWIKSGQKVSPALSNDFDRSLSELVTALTGRWGNQENMFKDLKAHGIDRIHSYQHESYSAEYLYERELEDRDKGIQHKISNPELRAINQVLKELRTKQAKLERRIETATKNGKGGASSLRQELADLVSRIEGLKTRRDSLPKTVLMMDRIAKDGISRLCDQKKLFFDWLKMHAIWSETILVNIATPFYKDLRDVHRFVLALLQSRTYVSRNGDTLDVTFPWQRSRREALALAAICEFLNTRAPFDLGLSFRKITFRVQTVH